MDSPEVCIVMTTWSPDSRVGHSRRTMAYGILAGWERHLQYAGPISLHIADDGSDLADWPDALISIWPRTLSRQERRGVGASLNAAFRTTRAPFVFYLQDDWTFAEDFDLDPLVARMVDEEIVCTFLHPACQPRTDDDVRFGSVDANTQFILAPTLYQRLEEPTFLEGISAHRCEQEHIWGKDIRCWYRPLETILHFGYEVVGQLEPGHRETERILGK